MNPTVGAIKYDARIDTSRMRGDSRQADAIASKTGENMGKSMEKGESRASMALARMAKFAKVAAVTVGVAFTAAVSKFVLAGGISRALNIEDAQAKLKGLGHDTKSVTKIMDSALASVKGTAFGLDQAATAAASAVAAGIKPGKDLTRVLALTGDTATITGRQFNEAGAIINKVLASNRLSMEEVNQLQDAGLPILSMLGKEYGKTASELRDMVSAGEIDSKRFLVAIEKNIGGAALASGNTTRGAWANMQAAMSRVGAAIVKDIIPRVRESFGSMTKWFDTNSDNIVNSVGRTMTIMGGFAKSVGNVARTVAEYLGPKLEVLWTTLTTQLIPSLTHLWKNVIQPLLPVIGTLFVVAVGLAIDILNALITVLSPVISWLGRNETFVYALIGAITTWYAIMKVTAGFNAMYNSLAILRARLWATQQQTGGLKNSIGLLRAAMSTPMTISILVGGALIAIGLVYDAAKKTIAAMDSLNQAQDGLASSNANALQRAQAGLKNARKSGDKAAEKRYRNAIGAIAAGNNAQGTNDWRGGLSWVGERGPELVNLPKHSQVIPNHELGKAGGIENNIGNIYISKEADGENWLRKLTKDQEVIGKGLTPQTRYS